MNVKIGICDDNESFCKALSVRIQCILKEISCDISIYHNGKAVLEALAEAESVNNQFDIIFLDIEMPVLDGFRTAEIIYKRYPGILIIFLTGHKEYLIKGYYVRAFRFLLKPVLITELKEALMSAIEEGVSKRFLFVESYGVHLKINVRDIMYIESVCNGCKIYTINMVYELGWSLKRVMEQLNIMEFYQISRKNIVSLYHIKKLESYQITMDDSKLLEVTRRRKKGLETARAEFIHKR